MLISILSSSSDPVDVVVWGVVVVVDAVSSTTTGDMMSFPLDAMLVVFVRACVLF